MFSPLRQWAACLLDFVYPPHCLLCGNALEEDLERLCPACWQQVDSPAPVRCGRCSKPLVVPADWCGNCASWDPLFEGALILGDFTGSLQQAVWNLKFGGQPHLGVALGQLLGQRDEFAGVWEQLDMLLPVPLHPARQRERGYNQSLHIARGVARSTGLPLAEGLLRRWVPTCQQARLELDQRRDNVAGAFVWGACDAVPRRVGVVDDVITTGETLNACCRVLTAAGVERVWAVALASPYRW
ncbi:MAG: ComF family protein [Candidatus Latescibacteria bacterium]|nr:ComF family protein [Candidatus Latescibacterota bacterium]